MRPLLGFDKPPSRSIRVDFPQPLGPTRARNSPASTLNDTSSSARNRSAELPVLIPNVLLTPTNSILLVTPILRIAPLRRSLSRAATPACPYLSALALSILQDRP